MRISIEKGDPAYRAPEKQPHWRITLDGQSIQEFGVCLTADDDEGMIRLHPYVDEDVGPGPMGIRRMKQNQAGLLAIEVRYGVVRINRAA